MSYKKIEDIQYLYENVDGKESDIEDLSNLIVEKLISEGYSENAIHSFMETADEFALQEKIMQLDEKDLGKVQKGLELLRKFGSRFIRKKPQQLNLNLGSKSSALDKGKEVVKKGVEVVKKNPKTSAVVGTSTLVGTSVATSNRGNNKDTNTDTETKAKPGTFKDSQGKEFPTTDTIRGTTRKELSTKRDPIINRRGRTTGYTKSEKDLENEKIDKQVDKYVADKKAPINKDLTIDKSAEGKAKYAEKAAERIAKETPKVDPKPVKMSNLERQNRARFGDAAIDKLKAKQVDFKKMQANSQLPGADRGAEKAKFIKKYPNSITAQKAAGLRDHYDPEEVAIDENRMASHTAGMSDAQKDAATSSVSRSTADKMGRRSDESAFKGRKKKTSARYSSTSGKKRKNTTGRGQPEQYRKSADSPENEGRYPYGRSKIVQGKGSMKGLKKEDFDAFDIVLGYLQESGQVDSIDEALYIMMEMDAATIQGIVRDFEILSEEAADKEKDDRLVKYGIGHDGSDRKAGSSRRSGKKPKGKTPLQKETEKKYGKGVSPLDVVKKKIEDEHGKGAIKS